MREANSQRQRERNRKHTKTVAEKRRVHAKSWGRKELETLEEGKERSEQLKQRTL